MPCFKNEKICISTLLWAFLLLFNVSTLFAADESIKDKIVMGNKDSAIEVYFISDWFCPSCKKAEPKIKSIYPKIQSKVAFYFIDYPINRKSINYSPYNLAFLINSKPQYLTVRCALLDLVNSTETPTDENMEKIAEKSKAHFTELSYVEANLGIDYFDEVVKKYKLHSTPILIITNKNTDKMVKLEGSRNITEKKVLKAISEVSK